jgi:hypothetical protein
MNRIFATAALALALGAVASHANAQSYGGSDYHKATTFEQTKAACEFFADSLRGPGNMPYWGAQHARAYDQCMTLHGYARNQ